MMEAKEHVGVSKFPTASGNKAIANFLSYSLLGFAPGIGK